MQIVRYPNDILTTPCEPVEPGSRLARDIASDLLAASNSGRKMIGLSAPQIGAPLRIFVMDKSFLHVKEAVYVNPEITAVSVETDRMEEECMSLPAGAKVNVKRHVAVTVKAHNAAGAEFVINLKGLAARCAQHEMDHINGITILEHATKKEKRLAMQKIVLDIKKRSR